MSLQPSGGHAGSGCLQPYSPQAHEIIPRSLSPLQRWTGMGDQPISFTLVTISGALSNPRSDSVSSTGSLRHFAWPSMLYSAGPNSYPIIRLATPLRPRSASDRYPYGHHPQVSSGSIGIQLSKTPGKPSPTRSRPPVFSTVLTGSLPIPSAFVQALTLPQRLSDALSVYPWTLALPSPVRSPAIPIG
jgi:hypothetical protein